jgi:hypothetical protein
MNKITQEQFFGNYRGIVKSHGTGGLCKIFFPGVYDNEFEQNIQKLPWAEPAQPLLAGGSSSNGVFQYPDIGTTVWAFFEAGDISRPVFFAATNNDKSKFIIGENTIKYNNIMIKFGLNNDISISTTGNITATSTGNINVIATGNISIKGSTVGIN